ncbi:hypothetical protein M413DRAFT_158670 [Hebeloma cylindrosporum]|uniref:PH domain-containing protein n=1 Tax=Hebeloma cylindrosporum TaxID=76867 RepID=A0A0C3C9Z8_HEBCY|nr:hypothetical protein M413DRAFT_158670 [Hebeloma cylindrosporum h7]
MVGRCRPRVLLRDAPGSQQHQRQRSFTVGFNSTNNATSPRCSPPPAFLIDDDPFANLTSAPSITLKRKFSSGSSSNSATRPPTASAANDPPAVPPVPPIPRSPLHEPSAPQGMMALVTPPSNSAVPSPIAPSPFASTSCAPSSPPPQLPRAISNGRVQARPAYQRPAFATRPSLPSLDTLARMNVVMTKKVRKGRVGAGLPFEPWDDLPSDDEAQTPIARTPSSSSSSSVTSSSSSNGTTTPPMVDVPSFSSSSSSNSPSSSSSTSSSNVNSQQPPAPEPSTSQLPQPQVRQPRPLLPSQILALGSIAADVEMVLPAPTSRVIDHTTTSPPPPPPHLGFDTGTELSPSYSQPVAAPSFSQNLTTLASPTQNSQHQPSSPRFAPLGPTTTASSSHLRPVDPSDPANAIGIAIRLSGLGDFANEMKGALDDVINVDGEVISSRVDEVQDSFERNEEGRSLMMMEKKELDDDDCSGRRPLSVEGSAEDGYFSDFLESYQRSAEGGGMDEDGDDDGDGEGFDARSYVDDSGALGDDGVEEVEELEEIEFATRSHLSYFYVSDEEEGDANDDDVPKPDGETNVTDEGDTNTSELPIFTAPESHLSSPPSSSSISLSRSLSSTSYSSHCSSNSSGGMEYTNANPYPNHSLSSLELELDGPAEYESSSSILSQREGIADSSSTRRSSGSYHIHSHDGTPALSRTRSSSEDSDVPLPSPNAEDWTSFPYSYHPGGPAMYSMFHPTSPPSALFAPAILDSRPGELHERRASEIYHRDVAVEESPCAPRRCHVGSARSDEGDLGHAFGEYPYPYPYPYSQLSPPGSVGGGGGAGAAGFGFGFDKVMLGAGEEGADVIGNEELVGNDENLDEEKEKEKEKDGLATSTSSSSLDIEVHRTVVTTTSSGSSSLDGTTPPPPPHFDTTTHDSDSLFSHRRILSYVSVSSQTPGVFYTRTPPSTPCESAAELEPFSLLPSVEVMDRLRASFGAANSQMSSDQPEDGGGGERYYVGNSGAWSGAGSYSYQSNYSSASGSKSVRGRGGAGGGGGRRNFEDEDDEDDEERRRRRRQAEFERGFGAEDAKRSSVSSEEEEEEDGYGSPSGSSPNEINRQPHQRPSTRPWVSTLAGSRSVSPSASTFSRSRSRSNTTPDSTTAAVATATSGTSSSAMPQTRFPGSSSYSYKHYNGSSTSSSRYVSEADSDSDDDVPLAQRIPGALTMQKTIRRQFKEEKEARRRERAHHRQNEGDSERRSRQMTLRPAGAGGAGYDGSAGLGNSSSHDAAILAAAAVSSSQPKRHRTLTLPGNSSAPLPPPIAFNPQDLARKLAHVQLAEVTSSTQHPQFLPPQQPSPSFPQQNLRSRSKSISRTSSDAPRSYDASLGYATPPTMPPLPLAPSSASTTRSRSIRDPSGPPAHGRSPISSTTPLQPPHPSHVPSVPSLRPKGSFRRPSPTRPSNDDLRSMPPLPNGAGSAQVLLRTSTTTSRPNRENPQQHHRSMSLSRGNVPRESPPPVPPVNLSRTSGDEQRKASMKAGSSATRPSMDVERPQRNQALSTPVTKSTTVSQQRVFVGNLQQFNMVEIGPTTTAGDVVSMMEAGGALVGWAGSGGWMVFEIAQDFGMERPVRSYELLADVQSGWLKDKTVNFFILRLTPLAGPLDRNSIPSSSPTHSGYIEWEVKRGKWSKRWMQLREHSIWLSKRDNDNPCASGAEAIRVCDQVYG